MEKINDLRKLLKHELNDLYSAETQLIEALPDMVKAARNKELKAALSDHLKVTRTQKTRLDKVRSLLNDGEQTKESKGFFANLFSSDEGEEHCKAMEGLIKEANSLIDEDMTPEVMDAAIIAAAQKVEHYEISSYGTAKAYAMQLGLTEVARLLNTTLDEEYSADDSLTKLAVGKVNLEAEPENSAAGKNEDSEEEDQEDTPTVKRTPAKKTAPKSKSGTRTTSTRATAKKSTKTKKSSSR
ncbi:MAG: ferritin-like domain-containing protein [Chitinophagaceae bacterium]|nr:ferritin-like domain-containing protein [Chitinophagaceae bacterium]